MLDDHLNARHKGSDIHMSTQACAEQGQGPLQTSTHLGQYVNIAH